MTHVLHRYYTGHELTVLCGDCAHERCEAGGRCEWAETPVDSEQAELACEDCGATIEDEKKNLSRLEPPDLDTLMRWMHDDGGCEAACPYGCWTEADGRCPHGKPSWLIVMGLI